MGCGADSFVKENLKLLFCHLPFKVLSAGDGTDGHIQRYIIYFDV